MDEFGKSVKILIVAICVALFAVGIIWNLFYGTLPTDTTEQPVIGAGGCGNRSGLGRTVYGRKDENSGCDGAAGRRSSYVF